MSAYMPLLAGILSPLLFTLFVDVLLQKLETLIVCYINFKFCNSFLYADDIILLSISISDLRLMFNMSPAYSMI